MELATALDQLDPDKQRMKEMGSFPFAEQSSPTREGSVPTAAAVTLGAKLTLRVVIDFGDSTVDSAEPLVDALVQLAATHLRLQEPAAVHDWDTTDWICKRRPQGQRPCSRQR